jgi:hypothetical protein
MEQQAEGNGVHFAEKAPWKVREVYRIAGCRIDECG